VSFISFGFDLDNVKNGTFLPKIEGAADDAVRHAGNHRGYREALSEKMEALARRFDNEVSGLGFDPSATPLLTEHFHAYQDVVARYQQTVERWQSKLRDELQAPSNPRRRLVENTDPLGADHDVYKKAWLNFFDVAGLNP